MATINIERIDARLITINEERRNKFYAQSVINNLPFCVATVDGINGREVPAPSWWTSGPGAWGCYRSHLLCIEQALRDHTECLLLLEDDAEFQGNFIERFSSALAELPDDWECLYLGCQHLNERNKAAQYYSQSLVIPYNANRTHAWMLSREGLKKVYKHLYEYTSWRQRYHIDHHLGQLHERGEIKVFACLPSLIWQGAAVSDLDGRDKPTRGWDNDNWVRNRKISEHVTLDWAWVGFGTPGLGGQYGYEGRSDDRWPEQTLLSVHAPSTIVLSLDGPVTITPRMGRYMRSNNPVAFRVDGVQYCVLQDRDVSGPSVILRNSKHRLEFVTSGAGNGAAQTLLLLDDYPVSVPTPAATIPTSVQPPAQQIDRVVGIEIITNSNCPLACPGCNQLPLRQSRLDYEYTLNDAECLLRSLESHNTKARLFFSGGEPAAWKNLEKVMTLLRASQSVVYTQIATSQVNKRTITKLKKYCDLVCCSIRADQTDYLTSPPAWLTGCRLWDQREHVVSGPEVSEIDCACVSQGIDCCVVGCDIYACTLAASHIAAGVWSETTESCSLDRYLSDNPYAPPATYKSCLTCPNNHHFREAGKKVLTFAKLQTK